MIKMIEQLTEKSVQKEAVLMCAPTAYALKYEINPWMRLENAPDVQLAACQWQELYRILKEDVGAKVHLVPQAADCPDMVFTANAGLVRGRVALLANFRHPERQVEEPHFKAWFEANGYEVKMPPIRDKFEGEGDALFTGDTLLAGYLKRSDIGAHRWMADVLGVPVLSLELTDDRWYHLDTCLFPLTPEKVVYYPGAFDVYARRVALGHGEVTATLEAQGISTLRETAVAGVWWTEHRDQEGALTAELLDIALTPPILAAHPSDVVMAAAALRRRLGTTSPSGFP